MKESVLFISIEWEEVLMWRKEVKVWSFGNYLGAPHPPINIGVGLG